MLQFFAALVAIAIAGFLYFLLFLTLPVFTFVATLIVVLVVALYIATR